MRKRTGCLVTASFKTTFSPGTVITGKWHKGQFVIQKTLGKGANDKVFLVKKPGGRELAALKMGYDALDLQSEINVIASIQALRKRQMADLGKRHRPYLLEVDDYPSAEGDIPFYVMRYVEGLPLHIFMQRRGASWLGLLGYRLLLKLNDLHQSGYIFGDLKPENIIVSEQGEVELIDYGGVSAMGRSVKQFTEWYDRGYWNAGSRSSDEGYDLFAFAVLCIHMLHEDGLKAAAAQQLPQTRSMHELVKLVLGSERLRPYSNWLIKAIRGQFTGTEEALKLWRGQMAVRFPTRKGRLPQKKTPRWLWNAFTLSVIALGCAIYLASR